MADLRPKETPELFSQRKQDHIRLSLDPRTQAEGLSGLERVRLTHEALPELNFDEITTQQNLFGLSLSSPIFVSSMTAGHDSAERINTLLAKAVQERNWVMGVGSQRKELEPGHDASEWKNLRKQAPKAKLFGNLGISQVIRTETAQIQKLVDNLEAQALFIHLNALQECLQPEGTPDFRGGLAAIERVAKELKVPVIVKEVGCGLAQKTIQKLKEAGVAAVDVSGLGGTHWGRIEGYRSHQGSTLFEVANTFQNWGLSTIDSLLAAKKILKPEQIFASGGVRSGLDAAKLIALGAQMVGVAQPWMQAAIEGEEALQKKMDRFDYELKVALFCTGCANLEELRNKEGVVSWT